MKVKVGNTIFDGEHEPVMVILSDFDKQNIANMARDATRYASYPEGSNLDGLAAWMADASYWHDAPYEKIAEIRVLETKMKVLQAVIRSLEHRGLPDADPSA